MAKISVEGNVGKVETGVAGDSHYLSFSLAERFVYFDKTTNEWVEKGTQWHDCVIWVRNDNTKKLERLQKFIVKGAGLLVTGRTSVNPSTDDKGTQYLNPYVIVDDVALTTERLEQVTYKPKSNNVANVVNDPELQQQGQQQGQPQQPVQQPAQQPPVQQATPFDENPTQQNNF
ncbi:MAG: single-stranded DNA-binding protein [Gammaproteobacteria bacterium]|nr:single-stranded DNA-binding protein [Gammaproteobacteria bacterium]